MIKLSNILKEIEATNKILVPKRSPEEREKNYLIVIQKQIQQYIKDGSKGNLDLGGDPITSLPDNLKHVGGYLNLENTKITSLPDNLEVEDDLYLTNTPISSLPKNLKIGGYLDLYGTKITSLPNDFKVGGNLYLRNTPITSLPDNLEVGGGLYLGYTPISKKYTEEEIRKMVPGVKGSIYIN
jgi:hypothetical protein